MTEEMREARRKYKREWAKANPDKVKRYQENFWKRQAAKMAASDHEPPDDAPELVKAV